jgi:glycosyltransferase involved in cell wall biosynthesis
VVHPRVAELSVNAAPPAGRVHTIPHWNNGHANAFERTIRVPNGAYRMSSRRPLVLHLSSDYDDGLGQLAAHRNRRATVAVNNIVEGAEDFDHVVFSLRRRALPVGLFLKDLGTPARQNVRVFAFAHYGLPLGVGLFHSFWLVARKVKCVLREHDLKPDAVHAHRLAFDGIAGWLLAVALDIPLFISIRGEVERKIFKFKPTYRPLMRHIIGRAAGIFYVSAWYAPELRKYTAIDRKREHLLPNIVDKRRMIVSPDHARMSFITVLNLNIWQKKGLSRLLPAFAEALVQRPKLRLGIIGGGKPRSISEVGDLIQRLNLREEVTLGGPLANTKVLERMSESIALVLPSHHETFGMVYLEALFAGTPILYSRGTGIDGFLEGLDVGIAVDPSNSAEIAHALIELADNNAHYRAAVIASADELSKRFGRSQVLTRYTQIIRKQLSDKRGRRSDCPSAKVVQLQQ